MDDVIITFDVDWAPDWMILNIAKTLINYNVKATWFVTHNSRAVDFLKENETLFELGLHPNLLDGSTQGGNLEEIMTFFNTFIKTPVSVRTHSLFQSEKVLQKLTDDFGIKYDCSIHLPGSKNISPHQIKYTDIGETLTRVPHFFQDNMYINNHTSFDLKYSYFQVEGLKVFNFHPIHLILNSNSNKQYSALKNSFEIDKIKRRDILPFINKGLGVNTLFIDLLEDLKNSKTFKIRDLVC